MVKIPVLIQNFTMKNMTVTKRKYDQDIQPVALRPVYFMCFMLFMVKNGVVEPSRCRLMQTPIHV